MIQSLLASLMLLQTGVFAPDTPLESIQSRSLCAIGDTLGQMDVISHGKDGIGIRIITDQPRRAVEGLNRLFFKGKPPGISEVVIAAPKPQLAFVVDDLGLHEDQIPRFWDLGQPLTWAILPRQKWTKPYATWLKRRFSSILAHVPMEPEQAGHMTLEGYITMEQTPTQQLRLFAKHLMEIPGAIGFNNHMGSRLTADSAAMAVLLRAVPQSWVVLDSRTTVHSQLARLARRRFPTVERTLFVDNDRSPDAILTQLEFALADALTTGKTVAIGHAYPETAAALNRFLKFHKGRVLLVPVERLATPAGMPSWQRRCPATRQAKR